MRRFLLHVLPRGFVKIRHFGFLANRERKRALPLCSTLLFPSQPVTQSDRSPPREVRLCPYCQGTLVPVARLTAVQVQTRNPIPALDTVMIGHALTIFIAPVHRPRAVLPEVCSKSFRTDRGSIFHRPRHLILPRNTPQRIPFSGSSTRQKSPNCHSKLSSISETASFK
jgi:hypothetical protein